MNIRKINNTAFGALKLPDLKKRIVLKNNFAYVDDVPYTGLAIGRNSKGIDTAELFYWHGKLENTFFYPTGISIYKKCSLEKKYYYNIRGIFDNFYQLQDGSKIFQEDYWRNNFETIAIRTKNHDTDSVKCSHILINRHPKYNNEPIVMRSINNRTFIIKNDSVSERPMPFKTSKEAQKFFKDKYDITVDNIKNLREALIIYDAIDALVSLNYKNLGDKLFSGLMIKHKKHSNSNIIASISHRKKGNNGLLTQYTVSIHKLFDAYTNTKNVVSDFVHRSSKSYIVHELGHYLHRINLPVEDLIINLSPNEQRIALEVSSYAPTNAAEFVAEYIAARLDGKTFSKSVNDLYKKYYGPDLFHDMEIVEPTELKEDIWGKLLKFFHLK